MANEKEETAALIRGELGPAFLAERERLNRLDRWWRWNHDRPHAPSSATREYRELADRAQAPWLGLVVTSAAQALYVEGFRRADDPGNAEAWDYWQANKMDARQAAVHRAALAYGQAYAIVLPGEDPLTGEAMPAIRGISPRRLMAFYSDPANDDWPAVAMHAEPAIIRGEKGWNVEFYDSEALWRFQADARFESVRYVELEEHGIGVAPIVRFANLLDLEGRADGEVEPFIPIAARIDQTVFDRLVVQRFASWVTRTIAGMARPESIAGETDRDYEARTLLKLMVDGILVSPDPDTKFGSLPATPLNGFIDAHDADVRVLAALSQTPPHHLLGQMANLSAEALAAAEASLMRKVEERKHSLGESWEQVFQLCDVIMGRAPDRAAQVQWADLESRSLAQAVDALAKLHAIGVPIEMLLEKIPGWTQQDVERAKAIIEQGSELDRLLDELVAGQTPAGPPA